MKYTYLQTIAITENKNDIRKNTFRQFIQFIQYIKKRLLIMFSHKILKFMCCIHFRDRIIFFSLPINPPNERSENTHTKIEAKNSYRSQECQWFIFEIKIKEIWNVEFADGNYGLFCFKLRLAIEYNHNKTEFGRTLNELLDDFS